MKKIYTISLDAEDYLSNNFKNNIRLIASMVYDQLYNYIGDGIVPMDINRYIRYNNIGYGRYSCGVYNSYMNYVLDSDMYDDGYINYEPFIVGKSTFGLTVVDEYVDIIVIRQIVQYVLNLLKLNYGMTINVFPYESKDINDERYRDDAMNKIYDKFTYGLGKRNKVRRLLKNTFSKYNTHGVGRR